MSNTSFILRGDLCWSTSPDQVEAMRNGYLVSVDGVSRGVFQEVPEEYTHLPVADCAGKLIVPGLTDLHVHAPQYAFRGLGMDLELLEWLDTVTFPEEARYAGLDYARAAYRKFVEDLRRGPNTRACIFATLHTPATVLLMDLLEESGLITLVGKVNMDRGSPDNLREESADSSARETLAWLESSADRYTRTGAILTPRFIPSCTDELMTRLGELQREYRLPVQSHLSENAGEVAWVRELCPNSKFYGDAYDQFGLFGGDAPTIMAHCVLSGEAEQELMKVRGVYIAHCPASNMNLSSGVAPAGKYLREGQRIGLGSDIAGGTHGSIFRAMSDAIQASKLRWRLQDQSIKPLTTAEAFYMGTVGGGSFFGKVGSFEPGYELDAVILDDGRLSTPRELTLTQRLERTIYLSEDRDVVGKFVQGRRVF
ncbi:putative guanine deaminase [uncultured Eubacteriales bacterium]|uniref:Putative guanine deaminase n=1 Tax=uncultured Eubacteriales bacterium TaxID=172733 RepID=A0A212K6V7_9FIRM|nr:putative guanine deaminase [uncultured Eubacteriales bacterium]